MPYTVEAKVRAPGCEKMHTITVHSYSRRKFIFGFDGFMIVANHVPWYKRLWRCLGRIWHRTAEFTGRLYYAAISEDDDAEPPERERKDVL